MKQKLMLIVTMLILTIGYGQAHEYEVDEYTVALWHFNEGTGNNTFDEAVYGNNGTIYGATWIDGQAGYALNFDGDEDYVFVPTTESIGRLSEVSLEAWIYRNSDSDGSVISKNGPYYLGIENNRIIAGVYAGDPHSWDYVYGNTELELDRWYHVAMSYDQTFLKVYLNDIEDGFFIKSGEMPFVSQNIYIGAKSVPPNIVSYFNGMIDEVRISNISRSEFYDLDKDGLPDNEDNCPMHHNPAQTDLDRDGVGDSCDNCVFMSNPGQADENGNWIGDLCEGCRARCLPLCAVQIDEPHP